jgi:hypothetical protein
MAYMPACMGTHVPRPTGPLSHPQCRAITETTQHLPADGAIQQLAVWAAALAWLTLTRHLGRQAQKTTFNVHIEGSTLALSQPRHATGPLMHQS